MAKRSRRRSWEKSLKFLEELRAKRIQAIEDKKQDMKSHSLRKEVVRIHRKHEGKGYIAHQKW